MNSRLTALNILLKINNGAYSNLILNKYLNRIKDSRDKSLITETVYGVLRNKKRLDYLISKFSLKELRKIDLAVLTGLRLAIYQIEFLDRIPCRAAIDETVEAVKIKTNRGAAGFVNGILRSYLRKREKIKYPGEKNSLKYLSVYYSHPEWVVKLWIDMYGIEDTIRLLQINNIPAKTVLRVNKLKIKKSDFEKSFKRNGIKLKRTISPNSYIVEKSQGIKGLPYYQEGGFIVQGIAASLVPYFMDLKPGMTVLDLAAAPGGKTVQIAEIMKNQGEITALELYKHRLKLIKQNCARMGVHNVKYLETDALSYKPGRTFDRILLDVPCSGLGLIRQKPEIKWNVTEKAIKGLVNLQTAMLKKAVQLVSDEGIIVYSTCTLNRQENQEVVQKVANEIESLKIMDINKNLQRLDLDNVINNKSYEKSMLEIFPPDTETEGFFIAKLKK